MFKVLSTYICWEKKYIYIKCNIWMVAERGSLKMIELSKHVGAN
jgi:hypothetical protein